jgi:hypothetical protein
MNPRLTMSRFRSGSLTTFSAARTLVCSTCISQRISYTRGACGRGAQGTGPAVRGESVAWHRDGRGASRARRDDRESGAPVRVVHGGVQYREYSREEQRSPRGCIARRTGSPARQPRWGSRMQPDFHDGLPDRPTRNRDRSVRDQNGRPVTRPRCHDRARLSVAARPRAAVD